MINQINLSDIRSFVLIAQTNSLSKTAEILGVSRSHVSRQLSNLEKQLGISLVNRTTRMVQLTETGKILLNEYNTALTLIEQASMQAINGNTTMSGTIRINCVGGYLGEEIIAPLVSEFLIQYPDVQIDLDFSSQRVDMLFDHFDVVFRMGGLDDGRFVAKKLQSIQTLTLTSPDYLAKHGEPKHPDELQNHRCIVGSVNTWTYQLTQQHQSSTVKVTVPSTLTCKNGHVMLSSAKQGLGIIRVPSVYCQQAIEKGELIPILQDWAMPAVDFSLLYRQDKFRPVRIDKFIEFITTKF